MLVQPLDHEARLDLEHVEATLKMLLRRRIPLLTIVAMVGSTEESAVDPLVFSLCSMIDPRGDFDGLDLILTSSRYDPAIYGHRFVDAISERMGCSRQTVLGSTS